jgi:hypothetical protein
MAPIVVFVAVAEEGRFVGAPASPNMSERLARLRHVRGRPSFDSAQTRCDLVYDEHEESNDADNHGHALRQLNGRMSSSHVTSLPDSGLSAAF